MRSIVMYILSPKFQESTTILKLRLHGGFQSGLVSGLESFARLHVPSLIRIACKRIRLLIWIKGSHVVGLCALNGV